MKASEPTTLRHVYVQHVSEHTRDMEYAGVPACTAVGAARLRAFEQGYSLAYRGQRPDCLTCIGRTVGFSQ